MDWYQCPAWSLWISDLLHWHQIHEQWINSVRCYGHIGVVLRMQPKYGTYEVLPVSSGSFLSSAPRLWQWLLRGRHNQCQRIQPSSVSGYSVCLDNHEEFIVPFQQSHVGHEVKKLNGVSTSLSVHKCSLTLPIWEAGLVLSLYRVDRVVPSFSFLFILEVLFGYRDQIICWCLALYSRNTLSSSSCTPLSVLLPAISSFVLCPFGLPSVSLSFFASWQGRKVEGQVF